MMEQVVTVIRHRTVGNQVLVEMDGTNEACRFSIKLADLEWAQQNYPIGMQFELRLAELLVDPSFDPNLVRKDNAPLNPPPLDPPPHIPNPGNRGIYPQDYIGSPVYPKRDK